VGEEFSELLVKLLFWLVSGGVRGMRTTVGSTRLHVGITQTQQMLPLT
jgi:hypothetical protein